MFLTILNLTTTTTMKTTFTNINWRNSDDSNVFNMHAIKSIELDTDSNIVTITCATNTFSAPFYGLTYGGGVTHWEFTTKHPYSIGEYIEVAIFESTSKVCITHHCGQVPAWFEYKCKTYIHL